MGTYFHLVNLTKREQLKFGHLPGGRARELAGTPSTATIVTWYLLHNIGDHVSFTGDDGSRPIPGWDGSVVARFPDKTDEWIRRTIDAGLLVDCGFEFQDPEEPDAVYIRDLRNSWVAPHRLAPPG